MDDQANDQADELTQEHHYTLYVVGERVYAQNINESVIDLGEFKQEEGGRCSYHLDVDEVAGYDFDSPESALQDIGQQITFEYLDGQFTALADAREYLGDALESAPREDITLTETFRLPRDPGEESRPHIF